MTFKIMIILFITVFTTFSASNEVIENLIKQKQSENQNSFYGNNSSDIRSFQIRKSPITFDHQRYLNSNSGVSVTGLDANIDENIYKVGTGDSFTAFLWGTLNTQISSVINLEGDFVMANVGVVKIKGLTLKDAKEKIKIKIFEQYKTVDVTIVLNKVKEFKAYILGEVQLPGGYIVSGTSRVSDLLQMAGGTTEFSSLRNIKIVNNSDSVISASDLVQFYKCNDISKNPYLNEGDRVFISKSNEKVNISGAVNYPGEYDYQSGDSLSTLIRLCGGLSRGADSGRIIIKRFKNDSDSLQTILCTFNDSSICQTLLYPDDRIIIAEKTDYRVYRNVIINGEVMFPGTYPIQKDKTKLLSLIEMAGGLTETANLRNSTIKRKSDTKFYDNRELERLKNLTPDLLSPTEKGYLLARITDDENNVSINLEDLFKSGQRANDIILRDGDEITIGAQDLSVKMIGGVISPGLVEFRNGEKVNFYINKAGGFSDNAKRSSVKILKHGTGSWRNESSIESIEAGDIIWVPEKTYKNGLSITKDVLMILGSVATVILSILTINQYVNSPE